MRLALLLALSCDVQDLTAEREDPYSRHLEACFVEANNTEGGYSETVLWRCLRGNVQSVDGGAD